MKRNNLSKERITQCHTVLPLHPPDAEIRGAHAYGGCPHLRPEAATDNSGECRSAVGITVGLVDAMLTIIHTLSKRDLSPQIVKEALRDLRLDKELTLLLSEKR
jgi:hypothetical protein